MTSPRKIPVVTGASSGIGSVYADRLAQRGYDLNFSRGLQQELANTGIRIQVVLPAAIATDLWDISGVPLAALAAETVMSVEHLVDAALAGFDQGESVTLLSMADPGLWERYDTARSDLFSAMQTGKPANRRHGFIRFDPSTKYKKGEINAPRSYRHQTEPRRCLRQKAGQGGLRRNEGCN